MKCGIRPDMIAAGPADCENPGQFAEGCIYEVPWESLALPDGGTDATLKHVPRSGTQLVLDFIVDHLQVVQAATGAMGAGTNLAAFMTALTVSGNSYMPKHNANSGAAVTSNKYALGAFRRSVVQRAGGVLRALHTGEGTPWSQFGVHMKVLGINDDVTVTIANEGGIAADFGGVFVVLQTDMDAESAGGSI